jgi:hypothetical protein
MLLIFLAISMVLWNTLRLESFIAIKSDKIFSGCQPREFRTKFLR